MERFRNSRGIPLTFKYLITIIILIVEARSAKQSGIKGGKRSFDPNIIILSECKKCNYEQIRWLHSDNP